MSITLQDIIYICAGVSVIGPICVCFGVLACCMNRRQQARLRKQEAEQSQMPVLSGNAEIEPTIQPFEGTKHAALPVESSDDVSQAAAAPDGQRQCQTAVEMTELPQPTAAAMADVQTRALRIDHGVDQCFSSGETNTVAAKPSTTVAAPAQKPVCEPSADASVPAPRCSVVGPSEFGQSAAPELQLPAPNHPDDRNGEVKPNGQRRRRSRHPSAPSPAAPAPSSHPATQPELRAEGQAQSRSVGGGSTGDGGRRRRSTNIGEAGDGNRRRHSSEHGGASQATEPSGDVSQNCRSPECADGSSRRRRSTNTSEPRDGNRRRRRSTESNASSADGEPIPALTSVPAAARYGVDTV